MAARLDEFLLQMMAKHGDSASLKNDLLPSYRNVFQALVTSCDEIRLQELFQRILNGGDEFGSTNLGGYELGNGKTVPELGDMAGELQESFFSFSKQTQLNMLTAAIRSHQVGWNYDRHEDNTLRAATEDAANQDELERKQDQLEQQQLLQLKAFAARTPANG